jgi:ATP-dependent Clp protease, protease subunit
MAALLDGMRDQLANTYAAKSGKSADECRALMAAETWMTGPQAVEAGFADTLTAPLAVAATFDSRRFSNAPKQGDRPMPATFADLKRAFPRAKSDFIVRCQERNLELDAARAEYDEMMAKALEEMTEEAAKAKAELAEIKKEEETAAKAKAEEEEKQAAEAKAKAKAEEEEKQAAAARARGVKPAKSAASAKAGQTATARWNGAINQKVQAGLTKAQAVAELVNEDPELQAEFLTEARNR